MAPARDPALAGVQIQKRPYGTYYYHVATRERIRAPYGPGPTASPEFLAEKQALDARVAQKSNAQPGSFEALFLAYKASPEFQNLAPRTRADYEKVMLWLTRPTGDKPGIGKLPVVMMAAADVMAIRNRAFDAHKRRFANYVVTILKLTIGWAAANGWGGITHNSAQPAKKIRRPRSTPKANRPWADFECEAMLDAAEGGIKLAVALGMFACMREGDAISVTRLNYSGTWLRWAQGKTGEPVEVPVDPRLKTILDAELAKRKEQPVELLKLPLVIGKRGQPYTNDGFRTEFWKLRNRLLKAGRVLPGLTFHGLRHTAGRNLAELGADPRMIAALLGHKTLAMADWYSREVNNKRLAEAAVVKLQNRLVDKPS